MLNYRGVVVGRITKKDRSIIDDIYAIKIPAISNKDTIEAKVLGHPTLYTNYYPKDSVLVGQISTTGDFIILGLIQRAEASQRNYFWHNTLATKVDQLEEKYKQDIAILRSSKVTKISKTLLATDWTEYDGIYSQSLQIPGVSEHSHVTVVPKLESTDAVIQAVIYPYVHLAENTITIYAKNQASANIEVIVEVLI